MPRGAGPARRRTYRADSLAPFRRRARWRRLRPLVCGALITLGVVVVLARWLV